MLIAIIVSLFLGGSTSAVMTYVADTRSDVKVVVEDKARQSAALETLKRMKKGTAELNAQSRKSAKALNKALKNHTVAEADIEAIWSTHFEHVDQFNMTMIDLRFELKNQLTRDEWQRLFGA